MKKHLFLFALAWCLLGPAWGADAARTSSLKPAGPVNRVVQAVDDGDRVTLSGHVLPSLQASEDLGAVLDEERMDHMMLMLKGDAQQLQALDQLIQHQHAARSPEFRRWLSPREFEDQFGASAADLAAVTAWLQAQGFRIDAQPTGGRTIVFSGTAGQIRTAFGTAIHRYKDHQGLHRANTSEISIPKALAAVVEGIASLNDLHTRPLHQRTQIDPAYTVGSTHYLSPTDFRTLYNLQSLAAQSINGSSRTIAILGRSNIALSDVQQFRSTMGLPSNPPQIIVNGSDPGYVTGDEGESDLDVQWAGAVAPQSTIKFVTSASTVSSDGIALSAQYAVSNNVSDIISVSYGACEKQMGTSALNYYNNLWQQATAQGITVVVSSGDSGAAGCDAASNSTATNGAGINGLCSSPYATCVGGTRFADTSNPSLYWASSNDGSGGSALGYIPETVWNDSGANGGSGLWASGGGASIKYAKPSWQNSPGVPADGKRDVPDVSLTASVHDGYLVYTSDNSTRTQNLMVYGGTSAAAPSLAGILALINQKTGYRQGQINPTLYGLASRQASGGRSYFHSITSGNNTVPGQSGFAASTSTPYYNKATGLGSVNGDVLVTYWTDLLPTSSTALSLSASSATVGQSVTLSASVTGTSPSGSVQFLDNGAALGSPVSLNGGSANYSTSSLSAGTHTLSAHYSGDAGNQASTSSATSLSVLQTSTTTLSASASTIEAGQTLTLSVTVSGASPTGTVQFQDGGSNLGAAVTLSNGTATLSTNALTTTGSHSITAAYQGDASNTASTSSAVSLTVTAVSTPPVDPPPSDGDVPTLPQWGMMVLALGLVLVSRLQGTMVVNR
ncbi:MAG: Ig-like domain repeat protein [Burkholderiales bacterium]|nr:Ig-like domain repeat protein [Burkholderiales bacterium]